MKVKATRDYRSSKDGETLVYQKGEEVDVDPDVVEWVNRDSPGTLTAPRRKRDG